MSYYTLEKINKALNQFTLKQIQTSLISVLPIYKQLALDNITDEEIPLRALTWVTYLDIFAIQTNRYGYFDLDNVFEDFEAELTSKVLSCKKHKDIKEFITNLYLFECERAARLKELKEYYNPIVVTI
ncbi:MAG TPA: hypothetical protein PL131_09470 [Methylotenera sp.]|nr:hypothetical protein [Methylotenera sp.]HPH06091.1 hypothetical protein [Methylotenera sp.]